MPAKSTCSIAQYAWRPCRSEVVAEACDGEDPATARAAVAEPRREEQRAVELLGGRDRHGVAETRFAWVAGSGGDHGAGGAGADRHFGVGDAAPCGGESDRREVAVEEG